MAINLDAMLHQLFKLYHREAVRLPPPCRQAFVMNKLQGYTHLEIASHLGISTSMVEKHIVRALLHCRSLLLADGDI